MLDSQLIASPLLDRSVGSTRTDFVIEESRDEGKPDGLTRRGVPLHRHRTEDEGWYVLEGKLAFQYGDQELEARAGSAILLPKGVPHTFWNPGPGSVRYLIIVGPKTAGLLQALHDPGRPRTDDVRGLYDAFDVDLLG